MSHTDSEPKDRSDLYRERNLLALAFIRYFIGHGAEVYGGITRFGWWPDTDDVNDEEWAVVWTWTPEGQVGWHIPRGMVPDWLDKRDPEYDGYTTDEKNTRVEGLVYGER